MKKTIKIRSMTMYKITILFFFLSVSLWAQNFTNQWVGHYSYTSVNDVFAADDKVFAASENTMFIYDVNQDNIQTFSTVEGLSGDTIATLFYSTDYDVVIIGYENGLIEVIVEGSTVRTFVDILNKPSISPDLKRINHLFQYNEILYISTGFGIVEFDLEGLEFRDTFFIGAAGTQINVTGVTVLDDTIFASTFSNGVFTADVNNPNLVDFNQWSQVISGDFIGISNFNNEVIVFQNNEISRLDGGTLSSLITTTEVIRDFSIDENQEYIALSFAARVTLYDENFQNAGGVNSDSTISFELNTAVSVGNSLYLGTNNAGLLETSFSSTANYNVVSPKGPLRNDPYRIKAYNDNLWVVYGTYDQFYNPFPLQRRGISHLDSERNWNNISRDDVLGANALSAIAVNPNNESEVFISSFQNGLLELNNGAATTLYNSTNSGLESLAPTEEILRIGGIDFDQSGNLWVTNSRLNNGLKRFSLETAETFDVDLSPVIPDAGRNFGFSDLVFDQSGNIFLGTYKQGVIGYNPTTQDLVKIENNLPVDIVDALAVDRNNQLWIGTRNGLRVLFNTPNSFQQNDPQTNQIIIDDNGVAQELLFDQYITDIEVDGSNNKWVATESSGAFYFSPDGQQTLAHFTTENSPLPDNSIFDITVDDETGSVYFATQKGLLEYKGSATGPRENLNSVEAFPNPVRPGYAGNVTIRGLTSRANVKITDIQGNLVYEEISEGGSIQWDTTAFGKYKVASGVYLILVTGEDQLETTVTKVLIVR